MARHPLHPPPVFARPTLSTATGEAVELSQLIGELMSRLHRRLAGDSLATINDAGLTMSQFVALHILAQEGGLSVGTMAERLRLSPAATSSLLDRLVQGGLIARTEAPEDRRQKRLAITPAGSALIAGVNAERMHEVAALLDRLSPRVRLQLAQGLVQAIEEMAAAKENP